MTQYIVGRGRAGRPTLQHVLVGRTTACGLNMLGWSRAYLTTPVPQILCLKCKRASNR